jgi:hypothetical protein
MVKSYFISNERLAVSKNKTLLGITNRRIKKQHEKRVGILRRGKMAA